MKTKLLLILVLQLALGAIQAQTLLKDIETTPANGSSSPSNWCAVSDALFIFEATNLIQVNYLFASDGTEAGTIGLGSYLIDTDIIRLGNRAFFGGCDITLSADSCASLYVSDGTVAGTGFFFDLDPSGLSLGITDIVAGDSLFFFGGHTIDNGYELWRSNGTVEGTYMVMDIATGSESGYAGELAVVDDIAYFAAYTEEEGIEPWRSGSSASGTYMIVDLNAVWTILFLYVTSSGGYIYFSGLEEGSGNEVRRTNGMQGNVELIGEGDGTTDSSNPRDFVDSDGTLYYVAEGDDVAGYDLFVYNHTGEPTHLDFNENDIFPRALMPFGDGEVIFNAVNDSGRELWRSNGTLEGTVMITDLYPGENDGVFGTGTVGGSFYVCMDSVVYFAGADGINAAGEFVYELFKSDGTAAGTELVSDHVPGTEGANPGEFFEFRTRIYFAATTPATGREPFYIEKGIPTTNEDLNLVHRNDARLYPNPVLSGNQITIELSLPAKSNLQTEVFDLAGRSVLPAISHGSFDKGNCKISISMSEVPAGFYTLTVRLESELLSFPLVVQ
ncbi:MAG: T9SS type A sorting domain-containing protein [Bacteroidia bacterium]